MILKRSISFLAIILFCCVGCDAIGQARLIPKEKLTPQQEERIAQAIESKNHTSLRSFRKPAVPMIIKAILDIANDPAKSRSVRASSDACNFIYDLGAIRDSRAIPALSYILKDVKKRTFHPAAAYALGQIGDKSAVEALWISFNREKEYIAKGDGKGPDYGWGLANDFAYQIAQKAGTSLKRLGENVGEIPKDKMALMHEEFERMTR